MSKAVVCLAWLVMACGDDRTVDPVTPATQVTIVADRPAGTFEALPRLDWSVTSTDPVNVEVRVQAPGATPAGRSFAGVRVATGAVRYLGADNAWSETEVAYATTATTTGTLTASLPFGQPGEWRIELVARDEAGQAVGYAATTIVVSATPVVRVALSRTHALAGDDLTGSVVLAKGAVGGPVKLLAWWQRPDGTAVRVPELVPLAYDGLAADVTIPLTEQPLDADAAPGTYTLVARLFDGAGAPLAYGAQHVEVCATSASVTGVVTDEAGAPLGAGATFTEVRAIALDREAVRLAPVGEAGDVALDLPAGRWLVSAVVEDAAGHHDVPAQLVGVTCDATAPLALAATAPVAMARVGHAIATTAHASAPPHAALATSACEASGPTKLRLDATQDPTTVMAVPPAELAHLVDGLGAAVERASQHRLLPLLPRDVTQAVARVTEAQAQGLDDATTLPQLDVFFDPRGVLTLSLQRIRNRFSVTLALVDGVGVTLRQAKVAYTPGVAFDVDYLVRQLGTGDELVALVREARGYPLDPRITFDVPFGSVEPSSQHTLTAHLEDCDGTTYPGRTIHFQRWPTDWPTSPSAQTDTHGDASVDVLLGVADGEEGVSAEYYRRRRGTEVRRYAVQRGQTGQLRFAPTVPVIRPNGSAVLGITSRDPVTGEPKRLQPIAVATDLGAHAEGEMVTTDDQGATTVTMHAGPTPGLGQARATGMATTSPRAPELPAGDPNTTSEYLVVSSPVALDFTGPTGRMLAGGIATLEGALHLDDVAMAGMPIALAVDGAGTLSASAVTTDDTGAFTVDFDVPPSGSGSARITATTEVEGLPVTATVTVTWGDATCDPAPGYQLCVTPVTFPDSGYHAVALDARGEVVGYKETPTLDPYPTFASGIWRSTGWTPLPDGFVPTGISDAGVVGGVVNWHRIGDSRKYGTGYDVAIVDGGVLTVIATNDDNWLITGPLNTVYDAYTANRYTGVRMYPSGAMLILRSTQGYWKPASAVTDCPGTIVFYPGLYNESATCVYDRLYRVEPTSQTLTLVGESYSYASGYFYFMYATATSTIGTLVQTGTTTPWAVGAVAAPPGPGYGRYLDDLGTYWTTTSSYPPFSSYATTPPIEHPLTAGENPVRFGPSGDVLTCSPTHSSASIDNVHVGTHLALGVTPVDPAVAPGVTLAELCTDSTGAPPYYAVNNTGASELDSAAHLDSYGRMLVQSSAGPWYVLTPRGQPMP